MSVVLRPIATADHDRVLAWNQQHVELLAPLDRDGLTGLLDLAEVGAIIEMDDVPVGFVVTFTPGARYDSINYRWFSQRHHDFVYLDRIVIDASVRRSGVGTRVYDEIESRARAVAPVLCLEVNLDPPNHASLAFHRDRGYVEVGQHVAGGHVVSLLEKPLRS